MYPNIFFSVLQKLKPNPPTGKPIIRSHSILQGIIHINVMSANLSNSVGSANLPIRRGTFPTPDAGSQR